MVSSSSPPWRSTPAGGEHDEAQSPHLRRAGRPSRGDRDRQPLFLEPDGFLAFVKLAAPLAILAAGQYFVIVSGEFDLSVGSLVTAEVVIAARLIDGDSGATWPVILLLLAFGALIGAVNGLVTTLLRVPSFIVTLGSLLILSGAVFLWTGGSPRGALSEEFRQFGRAPWGPCRGRYSSSPPSSPASSRSCAPTSAAP